MKVKISILFILSIFLVSCQDTIDLNLKNNYESIVIEGVVTDDPSTSQTVKITRSIDLDDDSFFPAVSNANVVIYDENNIKDTLTEVSPGIYQTNTIAGVSGLTYYLEVTIDGELYTSECKMPQKVNLDTIKLFSGAGGPFGGSNSPIPVYQDPLGKGNYYKFNLKVNGESSSSLILFDDQINDGSINTRPIGDNSLTIETGDSIEVSMLCMPERVYKYFFALSQNGSGPNASASPANPESNIRGAKLGYFSAHTTQTKKIKVP